MIILARFPLREGESNAQSLRIPGRCYPALRSGSRRLSGKNRSSARPIADATLKLTGGSVAAGIGYVWGNGKLLYKGTMHPFRLSGISILDVGAAKLFAVGAVYNLKRLEDVNGTYLAISEGLAVASGTSGLTMKNERGAVIKFLAASKGARLDLGADGMRVKLEN